MQETLDVYAPAALPNFVFIKLEEIFDIRRTSTATETDLNQADQILSEKRLHSSSSEIKNTM